MRKLWKEHIGVHDWFWAALIASVYRSEVGNEKRNNGLKLTGVVFCKTSAHALGVFNELFSTVQDTRLLVGGLFMKGKVRTHKYLCEEELASFDVRALLVKSLQHVLKHFSARLAYMRRKSCIFWG